MENEYKEKGPNVNIAALIIKNFPFLKMYTSYVNNYQNSLKTLTHLDRISRFADWIKEKQTSKACFGMDLSSLMISCVQRVPRYVKNKKKINKKNK